MRGRGERERERVRGWEERGGRGGRYMYVEGGGRGVYVHVLYTREEKKE